LIGLGSHFPELSRRISIRIALNDVSRRLDQIIDEAGQTGRKFGQDHLFK
jgi:hypothetical protein